ncbi:MAG: NIPSNAP family protein [Acidobacteria bacterium]|nr:NIPSNAP family protein [Acidobacteriota bacterium]
MDRRSFMHGMGGATMLSAIGASAQAQGSKKKTSLYRLGFYYMRQGDQGARMNKFLAAQLPLLKKIIPGPLGIFTVFVGPHSPAVVTLAGYSGFAEMEAATAKFQNDPGFQKAVAEMEEGAEPPYDRADVVLLQATDYSPEIVPLREKPKTARIFELRVYHSPTQKQLRALHERFSGAEIKIFHRVGVHPILYTSTLIGPNMPNLTYLTPFANLAEREKAWDAFGADPEWIKVRKESIDRAGQISSQISITLLKPTDYSPIQ